VPNIPGRELFLLSHELMDPADALQVVGGQLPECGEQGLVTLDLSTFVPCLRIRSAGLPDEQAEFPARPSALGLREDQVEVRARLLEEIVPPRRRPYGYAIQPDAAEVEGVVMHVASWREENPVSDVVTYFFAKRADTAELAIKELPMPEVDPAVI